MQSRRAPKPVRKDIQAQRWYGATLFVLGMCYLAIAATIGRTRLHGWWALLPIAAGVILLSLSRRQFRQARARWHGISREQQSIGRAESLLRRRGFDVQPNVAIRGLGDVDVMLGRSGASVPIEIKAYRTWDPASERGWHAIRQVELVRDRLDAKLGILWLPDVKVGFWRQVFGSRIRSVHVVYGAPRNLARIASWRAP